MFIIERTKRGLGLVLPLLGGMFAVKIFLEFAGLTSLALLTGVFLIMCLIVYSPMLGIWSVIAGTSFIPYYGTPELFNIGSVHLPDVILYLLYAALLVKVRMSRENRFFRTPLDLPISLFFLVGVLNLVFGRVVYQYNFFEAFREFKVVSFYLLGFLVANHFCQGKVLKKLIVGCLWLGIIGALIIIVKSLANPPSGFELPVEVFYKQQMVNGGVLQFWTLICLFCLLLVNKIRLFYIIGSVICLVSFILVFQRHNWISIIFCSLLSFALVFKKNWAAIAKTAAMIIALLMLISVMTIMKVQPMANYVHLVILRAESLTAGQKIHNVEARMIENKFAIEEILAHPIFGIGFTRHYRPQIYGPNDNLQWYLHNGYLWILLKMGILGLIPFLWFSYIFVKRGIKNWQSVEDRFFKAIVLGSVISYLGVALTNFACAYFMENWQTAVFGLSFGINEVIYRVEGIDSKFDQTSDYMLSIPLGDG